VLIPAAAGLFGAWWGASITRKSAREAAKHVEQIQRRADIIELRAAARLLTEQLRDTNIIIKQSIESERWILPHSSAFDRTVWDTSRVALARLVDEPEWNAILRGVDTAIGFESMAIEFEGPLVIEDQSAMLKSFSNEVGQAIDLLRRYRVAGDLIQDDLGMGIRSL